MQFWKDASDMKPLGSITMYFPFVNDETRATMENLMNQAYNYHNFTTLLCEKALLDDAIESIVFLAYLHAFNIYSIEEMEKLSRRYSEHPIIKPFHLWMRSYTGIETDWKKFREAIHIALSLDIEDWVTVEMHLLLLSAYGMQPHWGPEESHSLEKLDNLLSSNPNLECYSSRVFYYHSVLPYDDSNKALTYLVQSLEIAKKYDDRYRVAMMQISIAIYYLQVDADTKLATDMLMLAKKEFVQLGGSYGTAVVHYCMGSVSTFRGEFSLAIEYYQEATSYMERVSHPHEYIVLSLAESHYEIGNYETTIELGSMGLTAVSHVPYWSAVANLQLARAKTELGILEETSDHLGTAKAIILKSGREGLLASYYESSGILDRVEGNLESAIHAFKESYDISQRNNDYQRTNIALLRLAETEVMQFQSNETNRSQDSSGPWLDELQTMAANRDLPGILALALLLKAELRFKQDQKEDADDILRDVRELAQQPGLRYLSEKVDKLRNRADIIIDF